MAKSSQSVSSRPTALPWSSYIYKPSSEFQHYCEDPRVGLSPVTNVRYPDKPGSLSHEKHFLRSWSHETYLWSDELSDPNPNNYVSPQQYFDVLKTTARTASGALKDNFHWYEPTIDAETADAGISYGYGLNLVVQDGNILNTYTDKGTTADVAGVKRGDVLRSIDGKSVWQISGDELVAALFPSSKGARHRFTFLSGNQLVEKELISDEYAVSAIDRYEIIETDTGPVGYIHFTRFSHEAQDEWAFVVDALNTAQVTDLVLDMRYNGGGFVYSAAQVSYMIAGVESLGKRFYQQQSNGKLEVQGEWEFLSEGIRDNYLGKTLPNLGLPRVYVLTTSGTCSASELVINGLRGIGVDVVMIGGTTCGKPYGYIPEPNCGTTYYTIQFTGVNAKGYGEYSGGFIPSAIDNGQDAIAGCQVNDDFTNDLGDPSEALLKTALLYREIGACREESAAADAPRALQKPSMESSPLQLLVPATRQLLLDERR